MFNNLSSWIGPHLDTETVIAQSWHQSSLNRLDWEAASLVSHKLLEISKLYQMSDKCSKHQGV